MNPYGVSLRQPQPNDLIGSTLAIAAVGTAFEASYGWKLLDGSTVLADGFLQAGSMGVMSAFVHEAAVGSVSHTGPATFEFAGDDPSAGEEGGGSVDVVRVAVVIIPGAQGYVPHQVVEGDTLSKIVHDNEWSDVATEDNIVALNGLASADKIRIGQVLRIPV